MANDSNSFREWMDGKGLKASDVAQRFGVSEQTIAHWRSQGVPERRAAHVNYIISAWSDAAPAGQLQPLLIHATREQFRRWNKAAVLQGKLIEDWATGGLDELAAEWEAGDLKALPSPEPSARVAEGEN